jgi:hypothetical protein
VITPGDVSGFAWRVATLPWAVGADVRRDAIDLGERAGRELASSGERAMLRLLDAVLSAEIAEEVLDRALTRVEEAGVAQRIVQRALEDGVVEQIADRLLTGPELSRIVRSAFRSELPDELVAQLLASEAIWILVDEVASSPAVTEAITHQGTGFAEQVGAKARGRSRQADAKLQRLAGRLGRKRHPSPSAHDPGGTPLSGPAGEEGTR